MRASRLSNWAVRRQRMSASSRSAAAGSLQARMKSQPASSAAWPRAAMPPAALAPSIDRSSLKTAPVNPNRRRSTPLIQRAENPAGLTSTRG
jgi:hypothetical protein